MRFASILALVLFAVGCRQTTRSTVRGDSASLSYTRKADALAKVRLLGHAFQAVRADAADGQTSFLHLGEDISATLNSWTEGWRGLEQFIDTIDPTQFATAEAELSRQLESQGDALRAAANAIGSLKLKADDLLWRLASAPRINFPLGPYQDRYDILSTATANLDRVIRGVRDEANAQMTHHQAVQQQLSQRLRLKLRARILAASIANVQAVVQAVDDLFLAEVQLDPVRARITQAYLSVDRAFSEGRYFRATDAALDMRPRCSAALSDVAASTVSEARRKTYAENIQKTCSAAEARLAVFADASNLDIADYIAEGFEARRQSPSAMCNGTTGRGSCESMAWVQNIDPTRIRAMDMPSLRALETTLDNFDQRRPPRPVGL